MIIKNASKEVILSTFSIESMEFGIDVSQVREAILHSSPIIKLPTGLDIFEGVINLRGNIIPIINMRKRFGLDETYPSNIKCIAIVNYKNCHIGLIFDDISQVVRINSDEIAPFINNTEDEHFAEEGIVMLETNNSLIQVLDLEKIFKDCDLHLLENCSTDDKKKFLEVRQDITFYLDGQEYAIGMNDIQEIVNPNGLRNKIKHCEYVCGVMTLRDTIIPIVCLKKYLGDPEATIGEGSKVIILRSNPLVGIFADSIKEVIHYEIDKLLPINHIAESKSKNIFSNIIALSPERNIIKISLEKLFTEEAKKQIEAGIHLNTDYEEVKETSSMSSVGLQDNRVLNKEFILFKLKEIFAVEIQEFQEIIKYTDSIIALPGSDEYIEGMLNLRSEPIVVINLRKYYKLEDYENKSDSRILILNINNQKIGIIVDEVMEILKTDKVEVTKSPQVTQRNNFDSYKNHIKEVLCVKNNTADSKCSYLVLEFATGNFISSINFENIGNEISLMEEVEVADSIEDIEPAIEKNLDAFLNEDFASPTETTLNEDISDDDSDDFFSKNIDNSVIDDNSEGCENERSEDETEQE